MLKKTTDEQSWPAAKVVMFNVADMVPYENNPNKHPDEQVELLARSMREDGVIAPILMDEARVIIYGHGRRLAALKNGYKKYPACFAKGWSEAQKAKVRLTDNSLGAMSSWDDALIAGELQLLSDAGFELSSLGFDTATLEGWGFDVPDANMPTLSDADRPSFQQMTFTLHDTQVAVIKQAIDIAKAAGEFRGPNENSNGNALARICEAYIGAGQREGNQDSADPARRGKRAGKKGSLQRKGRGK